VFDPGVEDVSGGRARTALGHSTGRLATSRPTEVIIRVVRLPSDRPSVETGNAFGRFEASDEAADEYRDLNFSPRCRRIVTVEEGRWSRRRAERIINGSYVGTESSLVCQEIGWYREPVTRHGRRRLDDDVDNDEEERHSEISGSIVSVRIQMAMRNSTERWRWCRFVTIILRYLPVQLWRREVQIGYKECDMPRTILWTKTWSGTVHLKTHFSFLFLLADYFIRLSEWSGTNGSSLWRYSLEDVTNYRIEK